MVSINTKDEYKRGNTFSSNTIDDGVIRSVDLDQVINKKMVANPEFKKAWEENQNEYDLIHQIVHIRKQEKKTQTQLANEAGCSQQVISRFENRECQSTFSTVCKIVNSLGYRLVLEPK